ncbi:hypothetical protein ACQKKX_02885 [Neorhizobium sp. NPDC001467]
MASRFDPWEEKSMIIAGLVAAICLGIGSVLFFHWRDENIG